MSNTYLSLQDAISLTGGISEKLAKNKDSNQKIFIKNIDTWSSPNRVTNVMSFSIVLLKPASLVFNSLGGFDLTLSGPSQPGTNETEYQFLI